MSTLKRPIPAAMAALAASLCLTIKNERGDFRNLEKKPKSE
jgi:hypothetical protein